MRPPISAAGTSEGASRSASVTSAKALSGSAASISRASAVSSAARRRSATSELDIAVLASDGERVQRAIPVASTGLHVEQSIHAPAKLRVTADHLFGERAGGFGILAALGLEKEAAQAEELGLGAVQHRLKRASRRRPVTLELRGLGLQQFRQRLVRQRAAGDVGEALRLGAIADADRKQPLGQSVVALAPAPLAEMLGDDPRAAQHEAEQRPQKQERHEQGGKRQHADKGGCLHLIAEPLDGDGAGTVGKRRERNRSQNDAEGENEDADHGLEGFASPVVPLREESSLVCSSAMVASAESRTRAFSSQGASVSREAGGSAETSFTAPARSPWSSAASARDRAASGSLPVEAASTRRTCTADFALAITLSRKEASSAPGAPASPVSTFARKSPARFAAVGMPVSARDGSGPRSPSFGATALSAASSAA